MTAITRHVDYTTLPQGTLDELSEDAEYIRLRVSLQYELLRQIGLRLEQARLRIVNQAMSGVADQLFMAWCEDNFDQSYGTLDNYRNLAKNLPELAPDIASRIMITALYKLAQPNADQDGVISAIELARDGQIITPKMSWIYAKAPEYIRRAFESEELSEDDAHDITRKLVARSTNSQVKDYAINHNVMSVDTINYVQSAYDRHHEAENPYDTTWEAIQDGRLDGYGWSKHISLATIEDLTLHKQDRMRKHTDDSTNDSAYEWVDVELEFRRFGSETGLLIPEDILNRLNGEWDAIRKAKIRIPKELG